MALSIFVVTKCEPRLERHLDQVDIYETIKVAIEKVGGQAEATRGSCRRPWSISSESRTNERV